MLLTSFFPNPSPLRAALLAWYSQTKRDLPWRRNCTPYRIWISEVMLQQTQMSRGVAFFENWMHHFPDLESLARASEEEVLRAWEGLGYYSRARNILKAARLIAGSGGRFPDTVQDLLKLPGIGTYTASAIASIACNIDVACVDANVERVLSRLCDLDLPIRSREGRTVLAELARDFLAKGQAGEHNQAMMELGALVCGKNHLCQDCPLKSWCLARQNGTVRLRPVLPCPEKRIPLNLVSGIVVRKDRSCADRPCANRFCVTRRPSGSVWGGLWAFPDGKVRDGERYENAVCRIIQDATGLACRLVKSLATLKTSYTKYNVTSHFYLLCPENEIRPASADFGAQEVSGPDSSTCRWIAGSDLADLPMPPMHKKLALSLFADTDSTSEKSTS